MIEKIKAEIERLKAEQVQYSDIYGSVDDYARASMCEGMVSTLSHLLSFIESLEKEQPQGLDEAADAYSENILANGEDMFDAIADGFKAGAEWMAWQGGSFEDKVFLFKDRPMLSGIAKDCVHALEKAGVKSGDRVIVQIRKK